MSFDSPTASACCTKTAEQLFASHRFRPKRVISTDRQDVTKALVASRLGVGLLHADVANEAQQGGEIELLFEAATHVRVLFAHLASRAREPILAVASAIMRAQTEG